MSPKNKYWSDSAERSPHSPRAATTGHLATVLRATQSNATRRQSGGKSVRQFRRLTTNGQLNPESILGQRLESCIRFKGCETRKFFTGEQLRKRYSLAIVIESV
ncbi:MAG: hypothetical protein ACE361_27465 [Aureliella sp.]